MCRERGAYSLTRSRPRWPGVPPRCCSASQRSGRNCGHMSHADCADRPGKAVSARRHDVPRDGERPRRQPSSSTARCVSMRRRLPPPRARRPRPHPAPLGARRRRRSVQPAQHTRRASTCSLCRPPADAVPYVQAPRSPHGRKPPSNGRAGTHGRARAPISRRRAMSGARRHRTSPRQPRVASVSRQCSTNAVARRVGLAPFAVPATIVSVRAGRTSGRHTNGRPS